MLTVDANLYTLTPVAMGTKENGDKGPLAHVSLRAGSWMISGVAEAVECRVSGLRVELGGEISPLLQWAIF